MTTNAAWLAAIQAMTVTGVTRRYTYPPTSLATSDLPASWPNAFDIGRVSNVSTCVDLNKTRTCTYQIAIEPPPQNTQSANYEAAIALLDNLETALDALTIMEYVDYQIALSIITVGGQDYWGLEATLTGSNFSSGGGQ